MKPRYIFFLFLVIATFFVNNQVIAPDIMESRNIITAREMVYDGHWVVTTMNGALRLEKPPLPTWLTALAEIFSPDNLHLQRGMAGLMAVLLTLYVFLFAQRILKMNPWTPTLLFLTSYNVVLMGRTATWDIYCHAFMMGCIFHIATALQRPGRQWRQMLTAGVYFGLSAMSKGPVSHYGLLLPFLLSMLLFLPPLRLKGKASSILAATVLGLAIGTWWYAYIYILKADDMLSVAAKESGAWVNHNTRPWWYYWKFFLETGVWAVLLLTAIVLPQFSRRRRSAPAYRFAMGWMLLSLLLLSLLPEKKPRYLLPLLIPASYVMASLLEWWKNLSRMQRADRLLLRLNCGVLAVAVAAVPVAAWLTLGRGGEVSNWALTATTAVCLLLARELFIAARRLHAARMLYAVTALFVLAECFALPLCDSIINNPDKHSIALTREMKETAGLEFYHLESEPLRIELVYAAHRKILSTTPAQLTSLRQPLVLLTHDEATKALPKEVLRKFEAQEIGVFDDNNRPKGNKRYSGEFVYHATVLQSVVDK